MESWLTCMNTLVQQTRSSLLRSLAEEYALGITLNTGGGAWLDASISRTRYPHPAAIGYHLNGGRYFQNEVWQQELKGCFDTDFLGIRRNADQFLQSDWRLSPILSR